MLLRQVANSGDIANNTTIQTKLDRHHIFVATSSRIAAHVVLSTRHRNVFFYIFSRVINVSRHASTFSKSIIKNNFQL